MLSLETEVHWQSNNLYYSSKILFFLNDIIMCENDKLTRDKDLNEMGKENLMKRHTHNIQIKMTIL